MIDKFLYNFFCKIDNIFYSLSNVFAAKCKCKSKKKRNER